MKCKVVLGAVCAALICGVGLAADVKSGPQPGAELQAFNCLNVTGADAGKSLCLV
jgi:hypothetical protein